MDESTRFSCGDCGRSYTSKGSLTAHKCTGHLALQCGLCRAVFKDRNEKYRHSLLVDCGKSKFECKIVQPSEHAIHESTDELKDTINDFFYTDLKATIDYFKNNVEELQAAYHQGLLHEAVLSKIHYTGLPENKNVYGIDGKGHLMYIFIGGLKKAITKTLGLEQSLLHVKFVVNSKDIRTLLTTRDEPLIKDDLDKRALRFLKRRHAILFYNKGTFSLLQPSIPDC